MPIKTPTSTTERNEPMATQEATSRPERSQELGVIDDGGEISPFDDIVDYLKTYSRQKPEHAALLCIGLGFVLGWKLKPW